MFLLVPHVAGIKSNGKANRTFCFASSQVWSEHRMQITSWDQSPAASLKKRTSQRPPVTSHTSSTRATLGQSGESMSLGGIRGDPQIQLITNHKATLLPRDPQTLRQIPTPALLMKINTEASKNSRATSMVITMATITATVTVSRRSIVAVAITTAAITIAVTTDMGRGRGSTSAGDGRNVCKGNFSF